jgi:hypothetical protein
MKRNYINVKYEDLDQPIYRIFSKSRFIELFTTKKLTLVKPKLWDDPFENFIMNATGKTNDGLKFKVGFREKYYGQCWTTKRESDAMWRIYSHDTTGIKVKTTIRKLFNALYVQSDKFKDISCFIGKVQYFSTPKLLELLTDPETMMSNMTDSTGLGQASTLLLKRIAFSHEKEIRIIYSSPRELDLDIFEFPIDPHDLIDQIVFDPRINYNTYKKDKEKLRLWGYKKGIVRSNLYKIPELTFDM